MRFGIGKFVTIRDFGFRQRAVVDAHFIDDAHEAVGRTVAADGAGIISSHLERLGGVVGDKAGDGAGGNELAVTVKKFALADACCMATNTSLVLLEFSVAL